VLAIDVRGATADPAEAGVRRDAVLGALQQLPERQREVLVLRYYVDLDEAGIADALGISRGAVKSHASRGAATLRTLLGASDGPESPEDPR
jgi:RNA polymerase sigma factor (sigma-70 family)